MSETSTSVPGVMGDFTARLLTQAGIGPGMRILDYGCGPGDVLLHVARLVGDTGSVLGIDRDAASLATARERARAVGLGNVDVRRADLGTDTIDGPFDAVVGRRVLMYLPDPVATMRALVGALKPGGLVVCQEHDAVMTPGSAMPLPLHTTVHDLIWRTVEREGGDTRMGFRLASVLTRAGLVIEGIRAEALVQTATLRQPTAALVRLMLPRMVRHGVASAEELDLDTLDRRLADELRENDATYVGDVAFGAWARKPG